MTQEVVTLILTNEIDPWALVRPFTLLDPPAMIELLVVASAGWVLPKWRHGVFIAVIVTPLFLMLFLPHWYLPLGAIAALNGVHFAVLLTVYSVAFSFKRLLFGR